MRVIKIMCLLSRLYITERDCVDELRSHAPKASSMLSRRNLKTEVFENTLQTGGI